MTTYVPKKGDRVRVTIEGSVTEVSNRGDWFDVGANCIDLDPKRHDGATYTIEKLADPEPEWVNGDVIHVIGEGGRRTPMIFCAEGEFAPPHSPVWSCASCFQGWHLPASVSEDWRNGDVEILYKADQPDGSSAVGKADAA